MNEDIIALALITLVGAMIQSGLGFGFSLFFVPFAALVVSPRDAVAVSMLLSIVLATGSYLEYRPRVSLFGVTPLVAGALVGTPFGLLVLVFASQSLLHVAVASFVLVSAVLNLTLGRRRSHEDAPTERRVPLLQQGAVGFLGGMIRGAVSAGGTPIVLYLHWVGGGSARIRGRLFAYFFWVGLPATLMAVPTGVFNSDVLAAFALAVPALVIGIEAGRRARPHLTELRFGQASMLILALTASVAIVGVVRTALG